MRILMLTSRIPYPPLRGDRIRTWNALRAFSARHDVDLLTFVDESDHAEELSLLNRYGDVTCVPLSKRSSYLNMLVRVASPMPFQASYYASRSMRDAVHGALAANGYDVVYAHLFRMAPFLMSRGGLLRQHPGQRFVLDMADAISSEIRASLSHRAPALRPAFAWEARKIAAYEARVARAFDETWVVSAADRDEVRSLAPGAPLEVMPNGFDRSLLELRPGRDTATGESAVILFVGNLSIPHNVDAVVHLARDVMPCVIRDEPRARLRVVGHSVSPPVESLGDLEWVDVVGYVESLQDVYRGADVFAAPLRYAAGVQNKVVEAMAAGIPSVVTAIVNRGLAARAGDDIIVRDEPGRIADEIVRLLRDAGLRESVGLAGRRFVQDRYSWDALTTRIEQLVGSS